MFGSAIARTPIRLPSASSPRTMTGSSLQTYRDSSFASPDGEMDVDSDCEDSYRQWSGPNRNLALAGAIRPPLTPERPRSLPRLPAAPGRSPVITGRRRSHNVSFSGYNYEAFHRRPAAASAFGGPLDYSNRVTSIRTLATTNSVAAGLTVEMNPVPSAFLEPALEVGILGLGIQTASDDAPSSEVDDNRTGIHDDGPASQELPRWMAAKSSSFPSAAKTSKVAGTGPSSKPAVNVCESRDDDLQWDPTAPHREAASSRTSNATPKTLAPCPSSHKRKASPSEDEHTPPETRINSPACLADLAASHMGINGQLVQRSTLCSISEDQTLAPAQQSRPTAGPAKRPRLTRSVGYHSFSPIANSPE